MYSLGEKTKMCFAYLFFFRDTLKFSPTANYYLMVKGTCEIDGMWVCSRPVCVKYYKGS